MGSVFRTVCIISGKDASSVNVPIAKQDGSIYNTMDEVIDRWREHYESVLNHAPGSPCQVLDDIAAEAQEDISVSTDEPTLGEVERVVSNESYVMVEPLEKMVFLQNYSSVLLDRSVVPCMLSYCVFGALGRVPAEWKDGIVVSLYKGNGIQSACSRPSYRPISLLSVPEKVFAHVLLARLQVFNRYSSASDHINPVLHVEDPPFIHSFIRFFNENTAITTCNV